MFEQLDAELLNAFGQSGSYTPAGGSKIATRVLIEEQEQPFGGSFDTRYQESERVAFVLATVAGNAKKGDGLMAGATAYNVREVLSNDGLLVKLSVRAI